MDLNKAAHIAQMLSIFPGVYCAYAAWVSLHPTPAIPPSPGGGAPVTVGTTPTGFLVALGAFGALLVLGIILGLLLYFLPKKLRIISAVYGTGPVNDMDVTKVLCRHRREGLVTLVTNDLFGHDPAPN